MENFYTDRIEEISNESVMLPGDFIKMINQMGLDTQRHAYGVLAEEPTHVEICKTDRGNYVLERIQGGPVVFIDPKMFHETVQRVEKWLNCRLFN